MVASSRPGRINPGLSQEFVVPADQLDFSALEGLLLQHERLRAHVRMQTLRAGDHVIKQGDACSDIFVLRAGLVKI